MVQPVLLASGLLSPGPREMLLPVVDVVLGNTVMRNYVDYLEVSYGEVTVKPVLNGHSKIDKTKILMTSGSLLKVESIAECSLWSILQYS